MKKLWLYYVFKIIISYYTDVLLASLVQTVPKFNHRPVSIIIIIIIVIIIAIVISGDVIIVT
jgi:hypothetical protein